MLRDSDSIHHLYLPIAYILTASTGIAMIVLLAGMYLLYPDGYPDRFTHYEGLSPGQPASLLKTFACWVEYPPPSPFTYVCPIHPEDALIFSRIQVPTHDARVKQITFYGKSLQVVDLIRHFGGPKNITLDRRYYI